MGYSECGGDRLDATIIGTAMPADILYRDWYEPMEQAKEWR
jgi:hypothetical protein